MGTVTSAEEDPDVRTEAAGAMLAALTKDKRAAEDFGDRNAPRRSDRLMPTISDEEPELVIPLPEGGEPAKEAPPEETPAEDDDAGDGDGSDDDVSVTGENLLTEAFGLRPIGYITPPPRPKPFRATKDPLPLASQPTTHPALYPMLLRLLACVVTAHDETRRSIATSAGTCSRTGRRWANPRPSRMTTTPSSGGASQR